jgi:hypothetical protein
MQRLFSQRRNAKAGRVRAVRPIVERLESRKLLYATTGDHFAFGSRITWSIVPDGTSLGGVPSNLIATLNSQIGPTSTWLPAIQDAFAEWENVANINLVQVNDSGLATDSGNIQQGSAQFGDIRIGGYYEGGNALAFTLLPPGANGGSDSGDIFLNTGMPWQMNSNYDLETVVVHEIGHALGLGHSASPTAAMYPYYEGIDQVPGADDVQGIQAVWGPRQEDPVEQMNNNLVMARAADLTSFINPSTGQAYMPGLDVASSSEAYWFKVTTPANASSNFTAQVQSWQLSSLSPRVQIYSASGAPLVQTTSSANVYGGLIDATVTNATPNTTYYIKVLASNSGDTGSGAYALTINTSNNSIPLATPPNTTVAAQPDQGGGALNEFGGANTNANTPVDIPDQIMVGTILTQGDDLLAPPPKTKFTKHVTARVKVPSPTLRVSHKSPKPHKAPKQAITG